MIRFILNHPLIAGAMLAVAAGVGAALVVVSGIVPIKASSGHWSITARFLDFAKLRSVTTHSLGVRPPPLEDEALVVRGAAHYELGCFPCHGGPGTRVTPVMSAMTPPPPDLPGERISRWDPPELFSIVKHGIKFTGMPAWPVQQRDDEVWAIVAFLRRMPELDTAAYRRLAYGDSGDAEATPELPAFEGRPPPRIVATVCLRCHSGDGTGRGAGAFPSLAGQRSEYLYSSLKAFRDRTRFSGIMSEIASRLADQTMREIAAYYEVLPPRPADRVAEPSVVARGRAIAASGVRDRDIPACAECHGPAEPPKNPAYPKLAAQHVRYLTTQLALLQERHRGGSPNVNLMHVFVDRLTQDDIRDVVHYYASLPADSGLR